MNIRYKNLGLIDYKKAWDYQEELFNRLLLFKMGKEEQNMSDEEKNGTLIFCEHPHVYTLGKSGEKNNLLISDEFLKKIEATYYKINRGGDITYHGPGQLVGYPIFDLEVLNMGVKEYIFHIEKAIIDMLYEYDIVANRLKGATGVWLDVENQNSRKICAIGVKASRYVTMHGFALNVNTNLDYFNYINPCGFMDKGVTSMQNELGHEVNFDEVMDHLLVNLKRSFNFEVL